MRQLLLGLAAAAILTTAVPAGAQQQGAVRVTAAGHAVTGDPQRLVGQPRLEPDLAVEWLQPGTRFRLFEGEVRLTRRGDEAHLGRAHVALREARYRGFAWSLEAGDAYFSPAIGEYQHSNLFTPIVTFTGVALTARNTQTVVSVVAGRTSAWRNIFGTDPETLGQTIGLARVTHRLFDSLDVNLRASRIRTKNLREFTTGISASDQAGGGLKYALTPELYVVADGGVTSYRRLGSSVRERDGSLLAGVSWLHRRGWVQVNASRFSPGDFPVLNYPLQDRESVFAAADYDLFPRVRVSGGFEAFRTNVDIAGSQNAARPLPRNSGTRELGAVRVQLTSRSTLTLRAEDGDRRSRPVRLGLFQDSDTGSWTAEWQTAAGRFNSFARYTRRENVDHANAFSSYTQHDASGQVFMSVANGTQLFGTVMLTRNVAPESETSYWQAGGGAQLRIPGRELWLRGEGTFARNVDLVTQNFVPRESLSLGLNGQIARNTTIGFDINIDRSPMPFATGTPWTTRSLLRVVRTVPTGFVSAANGSSPIEMTAGRGSGSVVGSVFADWNANGVADPGEEALEGIPLRLGAGGATKSGHDGQFAFLSVSVGLRDVGLDVSALPVDFDPPPVTSLQVELGRGDTRRVTFGLIPLGTIEGRVVRDENRNGRADAGEPAVEGGVIVVDDGMRSEQVRTGRYRFDAVRSGEHRVKLLIESLPEGAAITGPAEVTVTLARERMTADVPFLISVERRPEIRKVFPPKGGGSPAGTPGGRGAAPVSPRGATSPNRAGILPVPLLRAPNSRVVRATARPALFTIQVTALTDIDRARDATITLTASGLPAYIVEPAGGDALYRVRIGPYRTRAEAEKAADRLGQTLGMKLWVTREGQ